MQTTTAEQQQATAESAAKSMEDARKARAEQAGREKTARDELTAQAGKVMATSRPTPSQEENDLLAVGAMLPDDIEHIDQPEMPPLHEQRAMIEKARGEAPGSRPQAARSPSPPPRTPSAASVHEPPHRTTSSGSSG